MAIYQSSYTSQQIDNAVDKVGNLFDVLGNSESVRIQAGTTGTDANSLLDAKVYFTATGSETSTLTNIPDIFKMSELGLGNVRIFNIINTRNGAQWWGEQIIMGLPGIAVRHRNGSAFDNWYIVQMNYNQLSVTPSNGSVTVYDGVTNVIEGLSNTLNIVLPPIYAMDTWKRGMNIGVMIAVGATPNITFSNSSNVPVTIAGSISALKGYYLDIKATKAGYIINPIEILSYNTGDGGGVLPDGYILLNYIVKDVDGAYIDTGITGSEATDASEIDIEMSAVRNSDRFVLPDSGTTYLVYVNGSGNYAYTYNGQWLQIGSGVSATTNRTTIKVDYKNKKAYINGTSYNISGSSTLTTSSTLKLLGRADGTKGPKGKWHGYKHYRNNTSIMDLRPALDLMGRVGMYDIVNNKFLTHAGTIGFKAGTKVNS